MSTFATVANFHNSPGIAAIWRWVLGLSPMRTGGERRKLGYAGFDSILLEHGNEDLSAVEEETVALGELR